MIGRDFVTAGSAIFTADNGKGTHYTFRVNAKERENQTPIYFLSLLTGPNNEDDYTYMGVLDARTGVVRLTQASKFTFDSTPFKVASWSLKQIWDAAELPAGYQIRHEGKCGRCGRTLTTPESLDSGIGPVCAEKALGAF